MLLLDFFEGALAGAADFLAGVVGADAAFFLADYARASFILAFIFAFRSETALSDFLVADGVAGAALAGAGLAAAVAFAFGF